MDENLRKITSSARRERIDTLFGHWKVEFQDESIVSSHMDVSNISYMSGYSSSRWQFGIDVILLK